MIIKVTGDERDVANSAWVSTLNDSRVKKKTQEQVEKVVAFLVEHHHTSPFESVTITFKIEGDDSLDDFILLKKYSENMFAKSSPFAIEPFTLTIDLLNFIKETGKNDLWNDQLWKLFAEARPILAKLVGKFGPMPDEPPDDVSNLLGDHGMKVELIHLHDEDDDLHSRATWRVKCPLSIAVQVLRHRAGSYNMTSGRYRTIDQSLYKTPKDVIEVINKAALGDRMSVLESRVEAVMQKYKELMSELKMAKNDGEISNEEYKRARECVRFALPEGRMTELYVTYYLSDFYGSYKKLRDSSHAQTEHIWIAQEMDRSLSSFKQVE